MGLEGKAQANILRGKITPLYELRGYSAYEVAVINGYKGTEEEWLDSLHGGPKGAKGDPGEDGYTPQIGVDYWTEEDKAEVQSYAEEAVSQLALVQINTWEAGD